MLSYRDNRINDAINHRVTNDSIANDYNTYHRGNYAVNHRDGPG